VAKNDKNIIQKSLEWIEGLFDKHSKISSKRFSGVLMITWSLFAGTYYVWKSFHGTSDVNSLALIEFTLATGASLLGAGTLMERLGKADKKPEEKIEE